MSHYIPIISPLYPYYLCLQPKFVQDCTPSFDHHGHLTAKDPILNQAFIWGGRFSYHIGCISHSISLSLLYVTIFRASLRFQHVLQFSLSPNYASGSPKYERTACGTRLPSGTWSSRTVPRDLWQFVGEKGLINPMFRQSRMPNERYTRYTMGGWATGP